jgi:hypothetical protein
MICFSTSYSQSHIIYQLFEWMNRRVQAVIALDEPGTGAPCYFDLKVSWILVEQPWRAKRFVQVSLRKQHLCSTNSRPEVGENGGV